MNYRLIKITQKELELLEFIRKEMPFGECVLITHNGQPQRTTHINPSRIFGLNEQPVDNLGNQVKKTSS